MIKKIFRYGLNFIYYIFNFNLIIAIRLYLVSLFKINNKKYEYFKYKHNVILIYLKKKLKKTISKYKNKRNNIVSFNEKYPIWVFWWEGKENLPVICNTCYETIKYFSDGHKINFITKDNYKDFVNIPDYFIKKVEKKRYSLTFFSDVLRMCLLYEHGGLWLDLTVLLTKQLQPLPEICSHLGFWVPKDNGDIIQTCFGAKNWIIREGRWLSFCIYTSKNNLLPEYARELFFEYTRKFNKLIDYFLVDYIISIAYDTNIDIRVMIDSVPDNNPKIHEILHRLNMNYEYNKKLFDEITEKNNFHKLNWKENFYENTEENKLTNYGYIIKNYPPESI